MGYGFQGADCDVTAVGCGFQGAGDVPVVGCREQTVMLPLWVVGFRELVMFPLWVAGSRL